MSNLSSSVEKATNGRMALQSNDDKAVCWDALAVYCVYFKPGPIRRVLCTYSSQQM